MWKPIGNVTADFELMINETSWGDGRWATNWQGRQRLESFELKDSVVGIEGNKVIDQLSNGNWYWCINCTYKNSITKVHRDYHENDPVKTYLKELRNTIYEKATTKEQVLELVKSWRRLWIPMRDREFGQFFESSSLGLLTDWKAGDVFNLPAYEYHAGATVGFNTRYTMIADGCNTDLKEQFRKLV